MTIFKVRVIQGSTSKTIVDWHNSVANNPSDAVLQFVKMGYVDGYEGRTLIAQVMARDGKLFQFDVTIPSKSRIEQTSERDWEEWG